MMANEEHVRILKLGVDTWNQWRKAHADLAHRPNLRGLVHVGIDLIGINLRYVDLTGADLRSANLISADLSWANLRRANLAGSNLGRTDLIGADLTSTNLRGANLYRADISDAILRETCLDETEVKEAIVGNTIFGNLNLTTVKYLQSLRHWRPSVLGIDTFIGSRSGLSVEFLRGCGLPESVIGNLTSQEVDALEFYSCFISFSSLDQPIVESIHSDLQARGVRCWYAPEDFKIGDRLRYTIDESVTQHDKLLLVFSEHSVASSWVEQEVETALERERKHGKVILFPIRLDNAVMKIDTGWPALIRNTRHIGDFTRWKDHDAYQLAFERLLKDLKAEKG